MFDTSLGPTNIDTITDFDHLSDVMALGAAIFQVGGPSPALPDNMLHAGAGFTSAVTPDHRLIYNPETGNHLFIRRIPTWT